MTRRDLTHRFGCAAAAAALLPPEVAFAQRALGGLSSNELPKEMVWLNANENPAGPAPAAIAAMTKALPTAGRYHYPEFRDFYAELARTEGLEGGAKQILVGAGSSEVLHNAVDAFTSATLPLIVMSPTYELPAAVAQGHGRQVINVPVTAGGYYADVRKLAAEADKAGGGLIYICNPNNPTSAVTPKQDIEWLVNNLPNGNTVALIDEAYFHFVDGGPQITGASAMPFVREGKKNVIVAKTFSKIYGMAGLRCGYACAKPELIARMTPFQNNVISTVTVQGVLAAIADKSLVPERKAKLIRTRASLCAWLKSKGFEYVEPQANFLMIDVKRDVREVGNAMARGGVAVGRPFPPLHQLLRVTIGTDQDMAKFREVFAQVMKSA